MQAEHSPDANQPHGSEAVHTAPGVIDRIIEILKHYLVREPVGMSVLIAFVAAAFTNSLAAFAIAGALSWFSAKHLLSHYHGERK